MESTNIICHCGSFIQQGQSPIRNCCENMSKVNVIDMVFEYSEQIKMSNPLETKKNGFNAFQSRNTRSLLITYFIHNIYETYRR